MYRDTPLDETPYVRLIAGQYDIPVTWLEVDRMWAMKPSGSDGKWDEPLTLHFEAMQRAALESIKERGIRFPTQEDYAERFQELFLEAVRCRLRSSTGVETMLSGGIDSSRPDPQRHQTGL